jgi:hypothetical protein
MLEQSEEDEAKPFLSAFLQSSVPDEIFADLRFVSATCSFCAGVTYHMRC